MLAGGEGWGDLHDQALERVKAKVVDDDGEARLSQLQRSNVIGQTPKIERVDRRDQREVRRCWGNVERRVRLLACAVLPKMWRGLVRGSSNFSKCPRAQNARLQQLRRTWAAWLIAMFHEITAHLSCCETETSEEDQLRLAAGAPPPKPCCDVGGRTGRPSQQRSSGNVRSE